jgi:RNA polymerase sigma-70 factor, ECF subfamily
MGSQATDEAVMQQLIDGDDSALAELMRRWGKPLRCFVSRMLGPDVSGEDICQNIWIRLYQYRDRYRPSRPLRSYLFKIAVNCCRTAMKRSLLRQSRTVCLDDGLLELSAPDPPLIDELTRRERTELLHQAILRLPPRQRAVVLLHILFDTDYRKIAEVLQISRQDARVNMHHALLNLRSTLTRILEDTESQVRHE